MEVVSQLLFIWIPSTIVLLFYIRSRTSGHGGRLPPGPTPLPIIGNLLQLGKMPHLSLARLAKSYGPLMSLRLGQVTTVVVSSPFVARELLQKKDQSFASRPVLDVSKALRHHEGSLIWLSGPKWRNLRRICSTQLFMSQRINDNQSLRLSKVRDLVAYVKGRGLVGEKVDIGDAAFTVVLNSISNTFFSIDMADLQVESSQNFRGLVWAMMVEGGKANVSDFFPKLAPLDLQGCRRRTGFLFGKLFDIFD